jgi:drug/metabolite transporter (DMT)-like permease
MSQRLAGNIIAMVSMALWASGFVALQALLRSWDPLLLAPLRMALAALALTLVLGLGGRLGELRALSWRQALITGGLGRDCSSSGGNPSPMRSRPPSSPPRFRFWPP